METLNICPDGSEFLNNKINPSTKFTRIFQKPFEIDYLNKYGSADEKIVRNRGESTNFEVFWILKGSGMLRVNSLPYKIKDDSMLSFSPGQLYVLEPDQLIGYRLCFSQEFLYMSGNAASIYFLERAHSRSPIHFPIDILRNVQPQIIEILAAMFKEYTNDLDFRMQILKDLFRVFIIYFTRLLQENQPPDLPESDILIFKKFTDLIKVNLTARRTVLEYACDLQVTSNYLNEIVKKACGYTASYHIQQHILHEAKRLATHSELSMKQISYQLGFSDIAHFSKFFRNNCGRNFSDFRRELL